MSRFHVSERIKQEDLQRKEQLRLKKKHQITQDGIVVVEKSNIYKFTVKTVISLIKLIATIILLTLAVIGLATLIYPNIRQEFLTVLFDIFTQLRNYIKM